MVWLIVGLIALVLAFQVPKLLRGQVDRLGILFGGAVVIVGLIGCLMWWS